MKKWKVLRESNSWFRFAFWVQKPSFFHVFSRVKILIFRWRSALIFVRVFEWNRFLTAFWWQKNVSTFVRWPDEKAIFDLLLWCQKSHPYFFRRFFWTKKFPHAFLLQNGRSKKCQSFTRLSMERSSFECGHEIQWRI